MAVKSDTNKLTYKLKHQIKDEKFNIDNIFQYSLCLQISPDYFRVCINDNAEDLCLFLEDYQFEETLDIDSLLQQLQVIYDDHQLLKVGFWESIKICLNHNNFTLVPEDFFDENYREDYLKLSTNFYPKGEVADFYFHNYTEGAEVFSIDHRIKQWFEDMYPTQDIIYFPQTYPLIEGALAYEANVEDRWVFLSIDNRSVIVVVNGYGSLEFCNRFEYTSEEDIPVYIHKVFEELELQPGETPVTVFGDIAYDSALAEKLEENFPNIYLGVKPPVLNFRYQFDEVEDHQYFDLFNMHICD